MPPLLLLLNLSVAVLISELIRLSAIIGVSLTVAVVVVPLFPTAVVPVPSVIVSVLPVLLVVSLGWLVPALLPRSLGIPFVVCSITSSGLFHWVGLLFLRIGLIIPFMAFSLFLPLILSTRAQALLPSLVPRRLIAIIRSLIVGITGVFPFIPLH